jgi:three-Cys-motif partner protein
MPVKNGVGQSTATQDKQDGLDKLLRQHMSVVRGIFGKYGIKNGIYYYIDAHAGCGYNYEAKCEGSPIIFLQAREELGIASKAYFIEIEKDNVCQLGHFIKPYLSDLVDFRVCPEDNKTAVPRIANALPEGCYGLIYYDPNGRPDWQAISHLSKNPALSKFDILIRYNTMAVKRNFNNTGKLLLDYLSDVHKKHWMIRDLLPGERWQWTFLLGMNYKINPWKSQRFYWTDSEEGGRILQKIANLKADLEGKENRSILDFGEGA